MTKKATREAYGNALLALGQKNEKVVVLDADLSKSTKTNIFAKEFPERFFEMGIAEQDMMATAAGLAAAGMKPFASTFAVFAAGRAFEQIRNSIAYNKLPVVIGASHAGITVGEDGGSHQSVEDIALMRSLPNMTVIVPADSRETEQAVNAAADISGPVYLRLGRMAVPEVNALDYRFEVGKGTVLKSGNDAAIIACGIMVDAALQAAEILKLKGIDVRVINMASIKPLDTALVIQAAKETGAIVTAEEHSIIGGLGSAVAETLAEACPTPLIRVGLQDTFGESGKPAELLQKYRLTAEDIAAAVEKLKGK